MTAIERQLKSIAAKLDQANAYERYMRVDQFCEKYGYSRREIDHLRSKYPVIWKGLGGDKVGKNDRTIWREILIDRDAFFALFSSPVK